MNVVKMFSSSKEVAFLAQPFKSIHLCGEKQSTAQFPPKLEFSTGPRIKKFKASVMAGVLTVSIQSLLPHAEYPRLP